MECRSNNWRDVYLKTLTKTAELLVDQSEGIRLLEVSGNRVLCYILNEGTFPPNTLFAGGCSRSAVFISAAIPDHFRYPVVVHEHWEINALLDDLPGCPDSGSFQVARWKAHLQALHHEADAALACGVAEEYTRFRAGLFEQDISRAGGLGTFVGDAYAKQRDYFQSLCKAA